ncbi:MAG: ABC transporter permease, partial [Candidatus Latescibacterota bacterium]
MFRNNVVLVLRRLKRDVGFSIINMVGLAVGLASCLLILLFVSHELSYDKGYDRADDIYRIIIDAEVGGNTQHFAIAPFAAPVAFRNDLASIPEIVRVSEWDGQVVVDGRSLEEEEILRADTSFFEIFSTPFIAGDPATVLDKPGSVVVTQETAERLFGSVDAVGRNLTINDQEMSIAGVVENPDSPSHLTYDYLVSNMYMPPEQRQRIDELWFNIGFWSYTRLPPGTDVASVEEQMARVYDERAASRGADVGIAFTFHLQPLTDIHLHSQLDAEFGANGDINYVYAFSIIAVFILLIACINFANLSTAQSTMRAKEVGVRKAVGAGQGDLVRRFLTDSFVTVMISMALAVILAGLGIGWMNNVTGKDLSLSSLLSPEMIAGILVLVAVCSLVAGSYPAFILSAFRPIEVLRGHLTGLGSKSFARRGLVTAQFAISTMLIVGTVVIHQQIDFMKNRPLGFDKDVLAVIAMDTGNDPSTWEGFRQTLLSETSITNASFASGVPGRTGELRLFVPEGHDSTETFPMVVSRVDHDFLDTYGMKMAEGRFYSRQFVSDTSDAFVINEAAAKAFGWVDGAVGRKLEFRSVQESTVIGVVKDYHFRPLTEEIAPLVLLLSRRPNRLLTVRFARDAEIAGMDAVRSAWSEFEPERPLDLTFVDDDLASRYAAQETAGTLVSTFAWLAILIAALGLFGLASFAVQRRTKEIG